MGDRNIANPFGSTQGQHYNDQDPTDERGQRRGQRRTWINASRYGSHEGHTKAIRLLISRGAKTNFLAENDPLVTQYLRRKL